ncbi:hypothetical protein HMPREF1145_0710 [Oribacterium parvum ACB8]|nr:hypothetical protein HMPREF1145_0710 [Oribacterium parvum ACB8]
MDLNFLLFTTSFLLGWTERRMLLISFFSEERLFSLKKLAIQNSGNIMLNVH